MEQSNNETSDFFADMVCTECGKMPPFEKKLTNMGVEVNINFKNWQVTYKGKGLKRNAPILCPLCVRRKKIIKLKECL